MRSLSENICALSVDSDLVMVMVRSWWSWQYVDWPSWHWQYFDVQMTATWSTLVVSLLSVCCRLWRAELTCGVNDRRSLLTTSRTVAGCQQDQVETLSPAVTWLGFLLGLVTTDSLTSRRHNETGGAVCVWQSSTYWCVVWDCDGPPASAAHCTGQQRAENRP